MTRVEANVKAREIISKYTDMNEKLYKKAKEEGRAGIWLGKDVPEIIALKKECGQRLKELYEKVDE